MKYLHIVLALLVLLVVSAGPVVAQDAAKKPAEAAKAMEKMAKSKSESGPVKTISCGPDCGFSVSTRDDKELVGFVQGHVKTHHGKEVSAEDVMKMAATEGEKK